MRQKTRRVIRGRAPREQCGSGPLPKGVHSLRPRRSAASPLPRGRTAATLRDRSKKSGIILQLIKRHIVSNILPEDSEARSLKAAPPREAQTSSELMGGLRRVASPGGRRDRNERERPRESDSERATRFRNQEVKFNGVKLDWEARGGEGIKNVFEAWVEFQPPERSVGECLREGEGGREGGRED